MSFSSCTGLSCNDPANRCNTPVSFIIWRALRLLMAAWHLLCHICIPHYGHQSFLYRFPTWISRVGVEMQALATLGEVMESEMSRVLAVRRQFGEV
jgi:hypothetical protein